MAPVNRKYDFEGKVALVTGSSSGIGAAVAVQLAQYGARVTITGRDTEALAKVASEVEKVSGHKPLQVVGDFTKDATLAKRLIDETVAKFGRLDVLVNNAGGGSKNGTLSSPNLLDEFDSVIRLNVRSVLELSQLAAPHLEKTKGNIVNISSVVAIRPFTTVYSLSKAALDMLTRATAQELSLKGIRVNSVNPGPVKTGFGRSMGMPNIYNDMEQFIVESTALKRIGTSEDIANLVSFLASDDAVNITGSIFVSDSGSLLDPKTVANFVKQ